MLDPTITIYDGRYLNAEQSRLNRHMSRILHTYANGSNEDAFHTGTYRIEGKQEEAVQSSAEHAVRRFLKDYPSPKDYEQYAEQFKNIISFLNDPDKGWDKAYYEPYLEAIDEFGRTMYGDSYDEYLASEDKNDTSSNSANTNHENSNQEKAPYIHFERTGRSDIRVEDLEHLRPTSPHYNEGLLQDYNNGVTYSMWNNLKTFESVFSRGAHFETKGLGVDVSSSFDTNYGKAAILLTQPEGKEPRLRSCLKQDDGWYEITDYINHENAEAEPIIDDWNKLPDDLSNYLESDEQQDFNLRSKVLSNILLFGPATQQPLGYPRFFISKNWYDSRAEDGLRYPADQIPSTAPWVPPQNLK